MKNVQCNVGIMNKPNIFVLLPKSKKYKGSPLDLMSFRSIVCIPCLHIFLFYFLNIIIERGEENVSSMWHTIFLYL
jgi:hypothetical protein